MNKLIIPVLALIILVLVISTPDVKASGVGYSSGDLFAGIGSGKIAHYSSSGVLLDTLDTTTGSFEQTGMCFDKTGNLYATDFTVGMMSKFDNHGNLLSANWGGPFSSHPESCVLDKAGNVYVGEVDGANQILKFDQSGTLLASYSPNSESRGLDWIDLDKNQCTMYYSSEGSGIHRFDVCTNSQLTDVTTSLSGPAYALRVLNNTNEDILIASTSQLYKVSSITGSILQTYPLPSGETSILFAMNVDPDGKTFWTAGYQTGNIYHVDISTGTVLGQFNAPHTFSVAGLALFGEPTVGCAPNCPQSIHVDTELSSSSITLGNSFTDNATLTGSTSDASGSITYNVYDSTAHCAGSPLFTSTTPVTNAKATPSSAFTPIVIGTYNVQAVYSGDSNNLSSSSECNSEIVTVTTGTGPGIATKLSTVDTYLVGPPVTDSATLTGVTSDASGTVTYNFYKNNTCTHSPVFTSQVTVTNGLVPDSAPFSPSKLGAYNVIAKYSGDSNNGPLSTRCLDEKFFVQPIITKTTPSANLIKLGNSVSDSATLLGVTSNAGGTVTYNFYSGDVCSGSPLFTSQVTVTNGLVPKSDPFTPTQISKYSIQALYSGDAINQPPINNKECEHFRVSPLTITTRLSTSDLLQGQSIKDMAYLHSKTSDAGGTVTYNFYSGDVCSGSPVFSSVKSVTNGKTTLSAPFTPTISGNYNAQAVYSGDLNNKGTTSTCGTEKFTVTLPDIIITSPAIGQ